MRIKSMTNKAVSVSGIALTLSCSTMAAQETPVTNTAPPVVSSTRNHDPLEPINRAIFSFNKEVDKIVYKPVAKVYKAVLPTPFRTGVTNFFHNLDDVPTLVNDLLQGHPQYAYYDLWRLMINTTVGVGGLIDVAGYMGLEKRYNDFGVTLGKWGVTKAPYIMVPFLGPSTIRDGLGLIVNYEYLSVWPYIYPISLRNSLFVLDFINYRASLLESEGVMKEASLDEYVFIRDAYLQKRQSMIAGNASVDPLGEDDLGEDWDNPPPTSGTSSK